MTFVEACELIRDIVSTHKYRVVHRYRYDIPWSFKFEKGARQYDTIDILYMHHLGKPKPMPMHGMIPSLRLSVSDGICLFQLSNGNWMRPPLTTFRKTNDTRKEQFEQITGIPVR